ncbi:adenosine deaminase [Macrosteles quadrilineatus]|uniref:adenosine deaminase n=1 Tax=Macrosteles quadrilineatus TaxID=74068 RepID=UPI0023E0BD6F|nr:adenosine deaminase [Macrosteles quadrilineatus]
MSTVKTLPREELSTLRSDWCLRDSWDRTWPRHSGMMSLAYEYCEDVAQRGVVYAEVRLVPQRLLGQDLAKTLGYDGLTEVVKRVSHGLTRAEHDLGIRSRIILIAMNSHPEWNMQDTLRLCQHSWDQGVVGLDLCTWQPEGTKVDEAPLVEPVQELMEEARKSGVFRTIHAGEVSGPTAIERAAYKLRSNRVGHGYHVVQDNQLYSRCLKDQIHFECCPYSSYLTGAVPKATNKHPILRFAEDGANFSISSDDPMLTGYYLDGDYELARSFGLTDTHLAQANMNAAKASFLPESEKRQLFQEICKSYNLEENLSET